MSVEKERHALATSRVQGALVGLVVVALFAVFWFFVALGIDRGAEVQAHPDPLRDWSTGRVIAELGDYTQLFDCAQIGATGMSGYVWVKTDRLGAPTRVLLICKP